MKIKAVCSFAGTLSMAKGEIKDCEDVDVVNDLLACGYAEAVETPSLKKTEMEATGQKESESKKKPRKRTVKADENK